MYNTIIAMPKSENMHYLEEAITRGGYPLMIAGRYQSGLDFLNHVQMHSTDIAFVDLELDGAETNYTLAQLRFYCPQCAWIGVTDQHRFSFIRVVQAMELDMCSLVIFPPGEKNLAEALDAALKWAERIEMRNGLVKGSAMYSEAVDTGQGAELAEKIYQFILNNHVEPLTMADIYNTFYVSESYVNRILMKHKKKSFKKILTEVRIQRAKELMSAKPLLSISEVAHAVGYSNSHYFSRVYKAFTGLSPSFDRNAPIGQEEES